MNKQSNIMGLLSFVVLSGIVLSFLSMINVIIEFVHFYEKYGFVNICNFERGCDFILGLVLVVLIFSLQVFLGYLFKKEKKLFPIYFSVILLINLLIEGSFYLIESINISELRLFFGLFYLSIFSLYLFFSKEGKATFIN